jgi:hypothetical protein
LSQYVYQSASTVQPIENKEIKKRVEDNLGFIQTSHKFSLFAKSWPRKFIKIKFIFPFPFQFTFNSIYFLFSNLLFNPYDSYVGQIDSTENFKKELDKRLTIV